MKHAKSDLLQGTLDLLDLFEVAPALAAEVRKAKGA